MLLKCISLTLQLQHSFVEVKIINFGLTIRILPCRNLRYSGNPDCGAKVDDDDDNLNW